MFRIHSEKTDKTYRIAVFGLLIFSGAALAITIWFMVDFLREQEIVEGLIQKLPSDATESAKELAGELRWQFRLTILVVLNVVVTGIAVVLLFRAYRLSQKSLRDLKALAGDILSSMGQVVITTDWAGVVTSINRRGLDLLPPDSECSGLPLSQLSSEIPLDSFREAWLAEKSDTFTEDFRISVNGSQRILRACCQTLSNIDEKEIGFVLQLLDVTDQVLTEEQMRRMERYMGLGSLAAGLHHEIKNPLTALSLHVQLLEEELENGNTSDEVCQMLGVIKTEVTRVGGVLESFRDFASIGQLNRIPINLIDLVKRQIELVTPQANQQRIEISFQTLDDSMASVEADRVRLEQVLLNLLVNAMESMPNGGVLAISTSVDEHIAKVEVTDTGSGIPHDLRDKIFDPYFTTKSDGTGLGLALCDKIMRQHNGSLDFSSSVTGTTFQMSLPTTMKTEQTQ